MFFRSEFYQRIPDFILQHSSKKADFSIRLKSETSNDLNNLGLGSDRKKLIGRELKDFALSESGIPYAIIALTAYFDLEAINTEGIFRKPAAFSEEIRLEEYLESQNYNNIFSIKNPIVVGGVFKKIFTKLPEPLFPYAVYEKLKDFNSILKNCLFDLLSNI